MAKQTNHDMAGIGGDAQQTDDGVTFPVTMTLETTIAGRDPAGATLQFTVGDMPQAAIEKMLRYGAQRIFNDAVGGKDTAATDKVAAARDMIERFKRGEIGRQVAAGVDAVTKLARRKAKAALKIVDPDGAKRLNAKDKAEQAETLDAILAANPHFVDEAKAELAARAEAVVNVNLEGVNLD